ncbi:MAG: type I restriction-modification system subunit M [Fimbriimonadaceae bacterium]|nr:type I restriction-modification system subunit M [Fimbriimonadaceae bacterium]
MNNTELKALESSLWEAADQLRANSKLTATEYSMPVLGLIFLRHATNRFEQVKAEIESTLPRRGGVTRALTADDFKRKAALYIPPQSTYSYLAALPSQHNLGTAIDEAMKAIEATTPMLQGQLPRGYASFEKELLQRLVRVFDREVLRTATGDVFGRIYEYFLNKFAMSGAQEGGEFFTPPSLVRTIVALIEPDKGVVFDPACGSAGMLVQSGYFIEAQKKRPGEVARFLGQEKSETNTKLAKMNLAVHGLEGEIQIGNTYYERRMELVGTCDFVMANPPFNVDGVDVAKIKDDPRLFTEKKIPGITRSTGEKKGRGKGKSKDESEGEAGGQTGAGESVNNANYLWIQYFRSYLKPGVGRAGFVMAASASDAGHGELEVRKQLIQTCDVDMMVAIGSNFFYTRTLPCTLWFLDRGKPKARRDKVLMLDARAIHRVVNRRIRDFSDEQLENLTAIVWLYRGQSERYIALVARWFDETCRALETVQAALAPLEGALEALVQRFGRHAASLAARNDVDPDARLRLATQCKEIAAGRSECALVLKKALADLDTFAKAWAKASKVRNDNKTQRAHGETLAAKLLPLREAQMQVHELGKQVTKALTLIDKELGGRQDPAWDSRAARVEAETWDTTRHETTEAMKVVLYFGAQVHWLQSRFPDAKMTAVPGLCRVVDLAEIEEQGWSLTPGRYVGTSENLADDTEYIERLTEIRVEFSELAASAQCLVEEITSRLGRIIE